MLPVSLVEETFRENGLTTPDDIHAVDRAKLREVFGADAAVYLTVKQYGTSCAVISSNTVVAVEGRICRPAASTACCTARARRSTASPEATPTSRQGPFAGSAAG